METFQSSLSFTRFSKLVLFTVFLVILAGGVVRMTQSGMGCPDWPKCFGRWIPPTDESQLPANYKQIYAFKYVDTSFNPYHTWIEYMNRLAGAILGILLFIQFLWSLKFRNSKRLLTWLCFANLLLTGFQGWLGSKVVEGNLEVAKVTTHMLVAILIAALAYRIIYESRQTRQRILNSSLKKWTIIALVLLIIQVVLGTQVREEIDHISLALNFSSRELWIERLPSIFLIHRSFSIIVAAVCIYIYHRFIGISILKTSLNIMLFSILAVILLGVTMNYFEVPALAQPFHLLISIILITSLYSIFSKAASS